MASRMMLMVTLAMSLFALTFAAPMTAAASKPADTMSCCEHSAGQPVNDHCKGEKKHQDEHCCTACALGLSFILPSTTPLIFSQDGSDNLTGSAITSVSRVDRPPIPPPRV